MPSNSPRMAEASVCLFSIVKKRDCWISVFQIQEAESRNKIFHISSSAFSSLHIPAIRKRTGIGLYLVKTYTELHGGHINGVTSNEGKGTSIGLNIPVIAVEKEEIPATQVKKQLESLPVLKPIEAESQDEKFLSNIIRLIEDHLSESELNVNALCELSGISNKQIYRKIKQLTGMSPVEYIKSIRMKKAAMLLQQKKFTIAEVMYMVGFSNHSYFSKCFQAEFGKTPRQYLNEDL